MKVPIFAGRSESGDLYILYKELKDEVEFRPLGETPRGIEAPDEFFLKLPDGELWALPPGSELSYWGDIELAGSHMKIQSEVWTGALHGSKLDLAEAKILGDD